jgi:hypothetical protein
MLRATKERGRRDFEDETKPAPLKPKGAAPSKIKTNSTHSQPLISAPPAQLSMTSQNQSATRDVLSVLGAGSDSALAGNNSQNGDRDETETYG